MDQHPTQKKAYLFGLAAVCLWSTAATAFKLSLQHLGPEPMVFYASLTSALVLAFILGIQGRLGSLRSLAWPQIRLSLLLGGLNPFLYYLILIRAYDLLRAQEAQAINYTWAITMSILSIPLLKQPIRGLQFAAIGLSYFGALIISTRGDLLGFHMESPLGFALAMGSTVIWALFWIFGVKDDLDPVLRLFLNKIDDHRRFIEEAPDHIKKVFTGEHGRCKHCKNQKGDDCRFRKTYTIDDSLIEMCNGVTFEFWEPTRKKLPESLGGVDAACLYVQDLFGHGCGSGIRGNTPNHVPSLTRF